MSLVRIAARICAVQALMGRTLVGDNVLDSQIGALDIDGDGNLRSEEDRPFISVYTDASKIDNSELNLRSFAPNGMTEFLFESGVTSLHVETDPTTKESVVYPGVPATDANLEFHLDIVARQIGDALSDPANEWAEIFRKFIVSFDRLERARTSGDGSGVKLAAHQIKVTAQLIADPGKGELKPTHPLARFLAKADQIDDAVVAAQVALMQAQLAGSEFTWQSDLRRYGLTRSEGDNLLITTPDGAEEDIDIVVVDASPAQPAGDA